MASERTYWSGIASERVQENRAWVRNLLGKKQPEFAAMLELVVQELLAKEFTTVGVAPESGTVCRCS
jgi:hypothetical protein